MKFIANTVAFVALSTSVTADSVFPEKRQLQSTENLCNACELCEAAGDLCAINELVSLACDNCASFNVDGLCEACAGCESAGCDFEQVKDLGCGLCDDATGGIDLDFCFSEIATVQKMDFVPTTTMMKDLKIGDQILTQDGTYEKVYGWGHHHTTKDATFFQIHSDKMDQPLEVTEGHLIFLNGKSDPVAAETIQVGDILAAAGDASGSIVTKIGQVERKGIYAPMTMGGSVVVDGVVASSYISLGPKAQDTLPLSSHDMIHQALSPYRMLCNGVSGTFCDTRYHDQESGMPFYALYGLQLLRWLMESNAVVKTLGLGLIVSVTGAFQALENTFGASLAPLVVFMLAAYAAAQRRNAKTMGQKKVA